MERVIDETWDEPGIDSSTEAKNLYYRFGSLNSMRAAAEITARAGLVLERRAEQKIDRRESADYEQFLSGCLFHEAALVSDGNLRASMLGRALGRYTSLIESGGNDLMNTHINRALRYSYDIQFLRLFDASGRMDSTRLRLMHQDLQIAYADDFLDYLDQAENHDKLLKDKLRSGSGSNTQLRDSSKIIAGNYANVMGTGFEWFINMSYRRFINSHGLHREAYIRTALPREEEPWFFKPVKCARAGKKDTRQMPKHGFDCLITRYGLGGEPVLERIQSKLGYGGSDEYLPGIDKVSFAYKDRENLLPILRRSAQAIKKECTNQPLESEDRKALVITADLVCDRLAA